MLLIKFWPILFDLLTIAAIYLIFRKRSVFLALCAAAAWAVNPSAIFNCACWGQTDTIMAMFWQMPSIQAFHSIVPGSVMTFYPSIGVDRGVGSRPDTTHYGIRGLLSVKYLFDYAGDGNNFKDGDATQMPGFTYYATQNGFDVYKNEDYIPYGFTYDTIITRAQFEKTAQSNRELLLLKAMMVEDSDFTEASQVLRTMSEDELGSQVYSQQMYEQDCTARARET